MTCEAIQLSEAAIVWVLSLFRACRERRGQREGRERAEPGSGTGAVGAHLQHHNLTSTPFSPNRPYNLMFIMCTGHTDGEDSALDRKVRILDMQLKYLTH